MWIRKCGMSSKYKVILSEEDIDMPLRLKKISSLAADNFICRSWQDYLQQTKMSIALKIPSTHTQALTHPLFEVIPQTSTFSWKFYKLCLRAIRKILYYLLKCQKGKAIFTQLSHNLAKVRVFTLKITGLLNSIKWKMI